MAYTQSTYTAQNVYDDLEVSGDLDVGLDMSGQVTRPLIRAMNATFMEFCGGEGEFPWKFNQLWLPQFVFNSWQQDYALVGLSGSMPTNGGPSVTNIAWLQAGIAIDINNPSMPKPWSWVKVVGNQTWSTSAYISNSVFQQPLCQASQLANNQLYYGTWGAAMTGGNKWGNNPQPNQTIYQPLASGAAMPNNPITQIQDANGNYLVLTGYGVTGNTAPAAAPGAVAGTQVVDGSCTWTVVDPQGQGIRLTPQPSQTGTVWQVNLVCQMTPKRFTATAGLSNQTLYPLTDNYYERFLAGCKYHLGTMSSNAKMKAQASKDLAAWIQNLAAWRRGEDREFQSFKIRPGRSILGSGGGRMINYGPFWPFSYPVGG